MAPNDRREARAAHNFGYPMVLARRLTAVWQLSLRGSRSRARRKGTIPEKSMNDRGYDLFITHAWRYTRAWLITTTGCAIRPRPLPDNSKRHENGPIQRHAQLAESEPHTARLELSRELSFARLPRLSGRIAQRL